MSGCHCAYGCVEPVQFAQECRCDDLTGNDWKPAVTETPSNFPDNQNPSSDDQNPQSPYGPSGSPQYGQPEQPGAGPQPPYGGPGVPPPPNDGVPQPPYEGYEQQPPYGGGYQQPHAQQAPMPGYYQAQYVDPQAKSKLVAGLLGIFLGSVGVHRFYLGYTSIGVWQIVATVVTCGMASLWGLVEGILYLASTSGSFTVDADGRPLRP